MKAVVHKMKEKVDAIRSKVERANAKSKEDLAMHRQPRGCCGRKDKAAEAGERLEHEAWCKGRRDYMDRGMGLCEGPPHTATHYDEA